MFSIILESLDAEECKDQGRRDSSKVFDSVRDDGCSQIPSICQALSQTLRERIQSHGIICQNCKVCLSSLCSPYLPSMSRNEFNEEELLRYPQLKDIVKFMFEQLTHEKRDSATGSKPAVN